MSAKIIENRITDFTAERPKVAKKKVSIWTVAATLGFVGSGLCLFAGLFVSALSLFGVLPVTGSMAYLSLGFLFSAFLLGLLAAHAVDKLESIERQENGYDIGKR